MLWTEWNGKYRDSVRRFWRGDDGVVSEFATRLAGSNDLYEMSGRRPYASINFVTAHDGFTMHDLVSYNEKHNEANGEENRDGENHNLSWNCGVEGPTTDKAILTLRGQEKRNLMATLLLSAGVPMLSGGDEMCRTQRGNNNAYCQDNDISWTNWELGPEEEAFLDFTRRLVHLRQSEPVLQRRRFFQGRAIRGVKDITWVDPSGKEMTDESWNSPRIRSLGVVYSGDGTGEVDERGQIDHRRHAARADERAQRDGALPAAGVERWSVAAHLRHDESKAAGNRYRPQTPPTSSRDGRRRRFGSCAPPNNATG